MLLTNASSVITGPSSTRLKSLRRKIGTKPPRRWGAQGHTTLCITKAGNRRELLGPHLRPQGRDTRLECVICRWDEWVPASRLLKLNEENVAVQKALQASANAASASAAASSKSKAGGGGANKDGSSSRAGASGRKDGARGTKRGRDEVRDTFLFCLFFFYPHSDTGGLAGWYD